MSTNKLYSHNPSTGAIIWEGSICDAVELQNKVERASVSQKGWASLSLDERQAIIRNFAAIVQDSVEDAASVISEENGKPLWEAKMEVKSLVNKVQVVFDAYEQRAKTKTKEMSDGRLSVTRYLPHGVLAVLGPFNFPMSMPNSHIMPALYAGNTVVFKPSERTPKSAQFYCDMWYKAGLPKDVLQVVYGDYRIGEALITHPDIKGVLFIGSRNAGKSIEKTMADRDRICVLEMGGNSPLIIWDYDDIRAAINIAIQSAYISSGQRCSAARRLIVNNNIYDEFITELKNAVEKIVVGDAFSNSPVPFMGPMIDNRAVSVYLDDYQELIKMGAKVLVPSSKIDGLGENFVKPGLVDITGVSSVDKEIFGPLLQVIRVNDIYSAIEVANNTQYGLAAGIVTKDRSIYEYFYSNIKAGIVNWNQPLTGSTTIAPFGGIKGSGNYHPAGFLSVDYCVYGCASIEAETARVPKTLSPGLEF